jgi:hypothetical protein
MLPVFGRPYEGPSRHAVTGMRGLATGNILVEGSIGVKVGVGILLL